MVVPVSPLLSRYDDRRCRCLRSRAIAPHTPLSHRIRSNQRRRRIAELRGPGLCAFYIFKSLTGDAVYIYVGRRREDLETADMCEVEAHRGGGVEVDAELLCWDGRVETGCCA